MVGAVAPSGSAVAVAPLWFRGSEKILLCSLIDGPHDRSKAEPARQRAVHVDVPRIRQWLRGWFHGATDQFHEFVNRRGASSPMLTIRPSNVPARARVVAVAMSR